jgi:hypothetical protein
MCIVCVSIGVISISWLNGYSDSVTGSMTKESSEWLLRYDVRTGSYSYLTGKAVYFLLQGGIGKFPDCYCSYLPRER